jgi:hypothetical protein
MQFTGRHLHVGLKRCWPVVRVKEFITPCMPVVRIKEFKRQPCAKAAQEGCMEVIKKRAKQGVHSSPLQTELQ